MNQNSLNQSPSAEKPAPEAERIVTLPEGTIPVQIPESMQRETGLKGLVGNRKRQKKADAYVKGFAKSATENPGGVLEASSDGSSVNIAHAAGYNAAANRNRRPVSESDALDYTPF